MKQRKFIHTVTLAVVSTFLMMASCEEELIGPEKANTPTNNFELFWQTFDQHYGLFEVKQIDWNATRDQYKSRINDQMSDAEFYKVISDMMIQLNDNHLNLYPTNGELPVFPGGVLSYRNRQLKILKVQEDYDLEVTKHYLTFYKQVTPNIGFGKLSQNLVYINIKGTDGLTSVEKEMEKIMADVADAQGLIIDIRGFYGGYDPVSQYLAGCFASSKKLYMTTKKRNGPDHANFTQSFDWLAEPRTSSPYTKPIVLLTSRFTQSAGETFTLALNQFNHVKTLGDTTAGSFSDNPNFELYNGWIFSVSVGDYRTANGESYEGIGLAPNTYLVNTKTDLLAGKDKTLEKAIDILEN